MCLISCSYSNEMDRMGLVANFQLIAVFLEYVFY